LSNGVTHGTPEMNRAKISTTLPGETRQNNYKDNAKRLLEWDPADPKLTNHTDCAHQGCHVFMFPSTSSGGWIQPPIKSLKVPNNFFRCVYRTIVTPSAVILLRVSLLQQWCHVQGGRGQRDPATPATVLTTMPTPPPPFLQCRRP
jgi:hypothetical protein